VGVRWLEIRFHTSWFAVVLPTKVADIWGENREEGREIGVGGWLRVEKEGREGGREGGKAYLEATGGDVTDGGEDVVGDPLHKVGGVLVDDGQHLLVHLLGRHAAWGRREGGREGGRVRLGEVGISFVARREAEDRREFPLTASRRNTPVEDGEGGREGGREGVLVCLQTYLGTSWRR